ncbi:hypothetical protein PMAYCL1PPCAC_21812, partial [Pristionchus mayeri]
VQPFGMTFWHELIDKTTTCDLKEGKWDISRRDIYDKSVVKELLDHKHTIICADSNPNPEQPTTTTTTTQAPLADICVLCKKPEIKIDCDNCVHIYNETVNECILKLNNSNYILTVSSTKTDYLVCKRHTTTWTSKEGSSGNVEARMQTKPGQWHPASYGILGGVILVIGLMGIGCVVIYFRMRKKVSIRDINKKKERGVTKKYTASNVTKMKIKRRIGRSSGGSKEGGKSKEQSINKQEENFEEAPTLKL